MVSDKHLNLTIVLTKSDAFLEGVHLKGEECMSFAYQLLANIHAVNLGSNV